MGWDATWGFGGPGGEENVMNARTGAEAITTRIGALAFPLGVILLVVSAIVHPGGEVMNNPVIFRVYAEKDSWIAVHFGQWFGGLLFHYGKVRIGGCRDSALRLCRGGADVGRYHDPTSRRDVAQRRSPAHRSPWVGYLRVAGKISSVHAEGQCAKRLSECRSGPEVCLRRVRKANIRRGCVASSARSILSSVYVLTLQIWCASLAYGPML
jgi:hypothetical protein